MKVKKFLFSVYVTASRPVIQESRSGIQRSHLDQVRLGVILLDNDEDRKKEDFEYNWISFLRLYNAFQFLPHAYFVTSTGVAKEYYEQVNAGKVLSTGLTLTDSLDSEQPSSPEVTEEWQEVFELVTEELCPLLKELALKNAPIPEVGYELLSSNGEVCGEAELAWESLKLAFLTENQKDYAGRFEEMGWQVVFNNMQELKQIFI